MSLLAAIVLSSSVAYAQRCEARAATTNDAGNSVAVANVRAEGMTEMVGGIELRCVPSEDTGSLFAITEFTLSVTLNTPITSLTDVAYEGELLTATGTLDGVVAAIATEFNDPGDDEDGPMIDEDEDPHTVVWEKLERHSSRLGNWRQRFQSDHHRHPSQRLHGGRRRRDNRPSHCERPSPCRQGRPNSRKSKPDWSSR